ncbi:reverse transcriptase-like protein [Pseudalkalibacillus hwajinpoensis]|uniref:Reverse transcriptase-like protein n=1 Tax=Guptibacillus hwajinpoensis TaxID=208199 RepID=A0A4U1MLL9_9BACL|nr:reverse transcriptase-like protein [Pseudalkalibacillus hwajinpoensis]TKD71546.1 reverse transcriptase-like protein [Pseudalkalibacillus hwajinpoensis]
MIEVYVDGASAGNPGPSGAGVFIKAEGNVIRSSMPLGILTNHEAEFEALIHALTLCKDHNYRTLSVRTDSQLVSSAVDNRYVKNKVYQPYLARSLALVDQFDLCFIKWIPSSKNKMADELARKAIQLNTA